MELKFVALLALPGGLIAQPTARQDSTPTAEKSPVPAFDFSGIIFANYQYRTDEASHDANKFDVERAYLTFRLPAGERTSVRITTDLYQQSTTGNDSFYRGWAVRAKYAYLQYDYLTGPALRAFARIGLIQTVFVEQDEQFWPRWIGNSPTEKAGYFSSADAGIATWTSLPRKSGEFFASIANGPGYTSRETDRFKDVSARLTLTPWGSDGGSALRTLALSVWGYKGALASRFVAGGAGQIGSVGDALERDRWGVHLGGMVPRATFAAQYARRIDDGETGLNTVASPRSVADSTGTLVSAYAILRPIVRRRTGTPHPLSLLARWDRVTTNTETEDAYDHVVAGVIWDFSGRSSLAVDYQESSPSSGSPILVTKGWFAHFVARF